jgi:hypothetical protein
MQARNTSAMRDWSGDPARPDPEDLARWLDCCVRAFDAREPFEIEYRLRRRDGEYRWFLDRGVPRYSPQGEFAGYAGVCVEIEAHKQAQAELARARRTASFPTCWISRAWPAAGSRCGVRRPGARDARRLASRRAARRARHARRRRLQPDPRAALAARDRGAPGLRRRPIGAPGRARALQHR